MRNFVAGLALALVAAGSAAAQNPPASTVSAATAPAPKKPAHKLICTDEDSLGTRLGSHRVCRYSDDIASDRQQMRMQVERSQLQMNNNHGG